MLGCRFRKYQDNVEGLALDPWNNLWSSEFLQLLHARSPKKAKRIGTPSPTARLPGTRDACRPSVYLCVFMS